MKLLIWGICLVAFCLPLYLVQFGIFGIPTTILELMIYALFVFWLVQRGFKGIKKDLRGFKGVILPIILIIIGVSLATIFSSDLRTSAGIWKAWFIDPLLFFIVVVAVIKNADQIKKVLYSLFLSGAVVLVISLVYLIQGKLDVMGRLQAFYNSPNYLAMYLVPGLVLCLGLFFTGKKKVLKILYLVSCILFLITLFFTKSFGAWLGIVAAVCFGLLLYLFKLKKIGIAWTILCLGLVVVLLLGYLALTQRESSFEARLVIWQKAWQVFKAHPILGIGPGTFGDYFPSYLEWEVFQPHNLFLAFLLQTGILGFIGFIWLLAWFFRTGFKRCKLLNVNCYPLIVLMSIMVYILIHGLADTTYWKNDLSVLFWIVVALMVVARNKVALDNNSFSNS